MRHVVVQGEGGAGPAADQRHALRLPGCRGSQHRDLGGEGELGSVSDGLAGQLINPYYYQGQRLNELSQA